MQADAAPAVDDVFRALSGERGGHYRAPPAALLQGGGVEREFPGGGFFDSQFDSHRDNTMGTNENRARREALNFKSARGLRRTRTASQTRVLIGEDWVQFGIDELYDSVVVQPPPQRSTYNPTYIYTPPLDATSDPRTSPKRQAGFADYGCPVVVGVPDHLERCQYATSGNLPNTAHFSLWLKDFGGCFAVPVL